MPSKSLKQLLLEKEAREYVFELLFSVGKGTHPSVKVNRVLRMATEKFPVSPTTVRQHMEWCLEEGIARLDNDTIRKKGVLKK